MEAPLNVSDNTKFAMPVRNLISLIIAVAFGVWAYFGIIERLNKIETEMVLFESDLVKNTEFRIKWPRGELGALPADAEQFMLIEYIGTQIEAIEEDLKDLPKDRSQDLTINFFEDRILKLEDSVEDLKDKVRQNGNH